MYTVLIIDDDPELRRMLSGKLAQNGFRVYEASNVPNALTQLKTANISLIILDLVMPGEHGTGLIRHLDEMNLRDVPVIVLSNVPVAAYQDRISEYLIKSDTSLDEIVSRVKHYAGTAEKTGK